MNKASFLTLVRQASRISDQDVEELEKLVVNFPYCQTAHLLIAKAAYDKGSMLSNQKLKKAAIYASNRQLLKKLIYTSDATVSLQPLESHETVAEIAPKVTPAPVNIPEAPALPELEILEEVETHEVDLDADITGLEKLEKAKPELPVETLISATPSQIQLAEKEKVQTGNENISAEINAHLTLTPENLPALTVAEALYEDAAIAEDILEEGRLPQTEAEFLGDLAEPETFTFTPAHFPETEFIPEKQTSETLWFEAEKLPDETTKIEENQELAFAVEIPEIVSEEALPAVEEPVIFAAEVSETVAETEEKVQEMVAEAAHTLADVPDLHELFLENASENIREPETAPEPEFAVNSEKTKPVAFLNDDLLHETLASFDQYLFRPEKEQETEETQAPEEDLKVIYPENEIQHIYDKDALGYWMSSSRLGESLQIKNALTTSHPHDFHPELIWEYSKTHELRKEIKPAVSKLSKQLEIIDEFLKMTPRLKTMVQNKVKPETQEDLSSRSSKINKNLASENFANILVQQGKIKKAIKIYEHLILKIPEKKPYFVAQIEKLKNME